MLLTDRDLLRPPGPVCDYFVRCDRPAAGHVVHPVAGRVAACARCAELAGLRLQPGPVSVPA